MTDFAYEKAIVNVLIIWMHIVHICDLCIVLWYSDL